ncbi:MAG: dehydrogenase [Epsilonproteobacteria bacterium]|nr:dehydrogenase [Campylobacterota bacterium]
MFAKEADLNVIRDLKETGILESLGEESVEWFGKLSEEEILDRLNVDFSSLFLVNAHPIESIVLDDKDEALVGLQNPVMQFYFNHGYDLFLDKTEIQTPDHIALEFAFMQNLILKEEDRAAREFLQTHLLQWAPQYLLAVAREAETPFYRELCEFAAEFLIADYDLLVREFKEGVDESG